LINLTIAARRDRIATPDQFATSQGVAVSVTRYGLVIVWYHLAGHHPAVVADRRAPPRTKSTPSVWLR
jgi:hypothetical protein